MMPEFLKIYNNCDKRRNNRHLKFQESSFSRDNSFLCAEDEKIDESKKDNQPSEGENPTE